MRTPQFLISRVVSSACGVVLVAAALIKLNRQSASGESSLGWLGSPEVQLAVVGWELLLGSFLLLNVTPRSSWVAALATFSAFALVSAYLGVNGAASCGCLGQVKANPWYAFTVDIVAVALLLIARPRPTLGDSELTRPVSPVVGVALGGLALLLAVVLVGVMTFGSVASVVAKIRGDTLGAPSRLDLGSGVPGQLLQRSATITNWTDQPIRLIGGTSDCSCVTTLSLPVTVPAQESRDVVIQVVPPLTSKGRLVKSVELWTDSDRQRVIRIRLDYQVDSE